MFVKEYKNLASICLVEKIQKGKKCTNRILLLNASNSHQIWLKILHINDAKIGICLPAESMNGGRALSISKSLRLLILSYITTFYVKQFRDLNLKLQLSISITSIWN